MTFRHIQIGNYPVHHSLVDYTVLPFFLRTTTMRYVWLWLVMVYTCQFCSLNFDGARDIRNHLTKGCKGQSEDASLLDASERYQAKKRKRQEVRAARRRALMIPSFTAVENEGDDAGWYDIPQLDEQV